MPYSIRKVSTFPYALKNDDEQIATAETLALVPVILKELGYGQSRQTIVQGTIVHYKGKTNAVYARYVSA